ncbi:hypothetical protein [Breoghania sp.]|uniref:GTA baseplate fiber-binding domain-containing protein n=1 Tax=Breoghania sp. TaxID=2065378 RepID=UPI00262C9A9B|nr:hypothetical protein [Breoghania sp.]MDJ0931836.1 hypothetical protein [Breoghania sp.]
MRPLLDLPLLKGDEPVSAFRAAAFARPWLGGMTVWCSASGAGFEAVSDISEPATMGELSGALFAGPTGRWDEINEIWVTLYGGNLSARADLDALAGANAAAVLCDDGSREVMQFAQAELVGTNAWRLSRLLRAQGGTEESMTAGASVGAAFVLLDTGLPLIDVGWDRLSLPLSWRVVPTDRAIDDDAATSLQFAVDGVALRPFSPVHVRVRRETSGDVTLSWIRRTRLGGDGWEQVEVPLGEDAEAYELEILASAGGTVLRTLSLTSPEANYAAADQIADFGVLPNEISLSLTQISAHVGRGSARRATVHVWYSETGPTPD